ncbi:MAG: sirohydrochlorin cobaltochelatase, partial [Lachnospiraceae bacterium]|nr:sirohydrochlorin cobaltochelatase [Lachnospiraceae bacterium]
MKKSAAKIVVLVAALALIIGMMAGCGKKEEPQPAGSGAASGAVNPGDADQAAADEVTAMIEAIQVQEWTEGNDERCAAAKAAWDALTDAQKELVDDPDYFGADTGDASLDDPRNQDEIGSKEILVVSFGTSFNQSRTMDIGSIEGKIAEAFPDWSVRRAFTAQIIINHVLARDGEKIDNVQQALERAVANNVEYLVVQPTHLMHGAEYDELVGVVKQYEDKMKIAIAEPLLGEVGADATIINADKEAVAKYVVEATLGEFGGQAQTEADTTAFVLMGHGTSHTANITY